MTKLERAAMQQALEALKMFAKHYSDGNEAITALREALKENEMAKIEGINMLDRFTSAEQAEQELVACNCGTNPWHDCNESEGCRIKKSLGISSRPVYDQRADHHKMMLGYEIATKYGVFENKAFQLCDEMKKLYAAPVSIEVAVLAEREACAKLVEPDEEHRRDASWGYIGGKEGVELLDSCAAAIRARGSHG